jgi:hypothetical protein
MIVLSTDLPAVPLIRSWSDADWMKRRCGATDGRRTSDSRREGRDESGRPMNLCKRCLDSLNSAPERAA